MDIETKKKLYKQLVEMSKLNSKKYAKPLMSENDFYKLSLLDALKYTFMYRDSQTEFIVDDKECDVYIELPDIDLEGQDLNGVYLSKFILGEVTQRNGKISSIKKSHVILKNTGAIIDLSHTYPNSIHTEPNLKRYSIDFEGSDFTGCEIFGILPDEYDDISNPISSIGVQDALDERYLQRRKRLHLSDKAKKVTDKAYKRLLDGKDFRGMRYQDLIDLSDYDLMALSYKSLLHAKSKIKNTRQIILGEQYQNDVKKSYVNNPRLIEDYELADDQKFFETNFGLFDSNIQYDIIMRQFRKGHTKFVEKCFNRVDKKTQMAILIIEAENGNSSFVKKFFYDALDNIKAQIINRLVQSGYNDVTFFHNNWKYIDADTRVKILFNNTNNVEFCHRHLNDLDEKNRKNLLHIINRENERQRNDLIPFTTPTFSRQLDTKTINDIINNFKKGEYSALKKHWIDIPENIQNKILDDILKNNIVELLESLRFSGTEAATKVAIYAFQNNNWNLFGRYCHDMDSTAFNELVSKKFAEKDRDFLVNFSYWNTNPNRDIVSQVAEEEYYDNENERFVLYAINSIHPELIMEIADIELEKNNIAYIKEMFDFSRNPDIHKSLLKRYKGNDSVYRVFIDLDNELWELCHDDVDDFRTNSSRFLLDEILSDEPDIEFIEMLIKNGLIIRDQRSEIKKQMKKASHTQPNELTSRLIHLLEDNKYKIGLSVRPKRVEEDQR